ncbi:protein farnesyltransferase/geranylgeranyltransferase type-1 subunit alpha-like [Paramacrobiotus metropolitanus]|uniref:protein farnesyltransferase/geranylgeranyltransferase type-1 subunit alpha-like n=1 Tax=Paramacrobiotus metropolitanus TaxID=2943436 RepID=UPI0024461975|nr:protein farnesyltransferase/geranylgeranyltransferase type-1 subunit alpha-like [Paramacrobiotus metropolitanus]XP_055350486.1 protein farnesyltransferase/geranylgeranyltransferase type-1 subunit alpha-like [Paramacrobiotus metropolitanus]
MDPGSSAPEPPLPPSYSEVSAQDVKSSKPSLPDDSAGLKQLPDDSKPADDSSASPSDDDSDAEPDFVPYEKRPEWQDIAPMPLVSGSVMPIAYTDTFKSVFGYFRAVMAAGEMSPRVLQLCEDAALLNAANYTLWMYRRKVLTHLHSDLRAELQYIGRVIEKNPKNYQVWYHRQKVVEMLKDPSEEFDFTAKILRRDAKNYHAWQHRQCVLRHFDIVQHSELSFTEKLIFEDPFNNSAWMHRFFVLDELPRSCGKKSMLEGNTAEIDFTLARISEQSHNESPWSFLRGLVRDQWPQFYGKICDFCEDLFNQNMRSPFLLAFMIDMYEEDISQGHKARMPDEKQHLMNRAESICVDLAEKHDVIRKAYWIWIKQRVRSKHAHLLSAASLQEV